MTDNFKVGLFVNEAAVNWMADELQKTTHQDVQLVALQNVEMTDDLAAVFFISIEYDPDLVEYLKATADEMISRGMDVLWFVGNTVEPGALNDMCTVEAAEIALENARHYAEEFRKKGQFVLDWDPNFKSDKALEFLIGYLDHQKSNPKKPVLNEPPSLSSGGLGIKPAQRPQIRFNPYENVIVVGGHRGCGSSFVSWNLAAVLGALLVATENSSIASWLHLDSSKGPVHFEMSGNVSAATVSTLLDLDDKVIQGICDRNTLLVIDVGEEIGTPLWEKAGKRVFVSTPDPQWSSQPFGPDENVLRVLNRAPDDMDEAPRDVFNMDVDLAVPVLGAELVASLWGKRPWILTKSVNIQNHWRSLAGRGITPGKEAKAWQQQQTQTVDSSW